MKKNFDMSGIQPKLREILEELDGRIPAAGMKTGRSGKRCRCRSDSGGV